jgi:GNAT superfamily N-acetyltransferase
MSEIQIYRATTIDSIIVSSLIGELLKDFNERSDSNFLIDITKIDETCKDLLTRDNYAAFIAIDQSINKPVGVITISQATAIYNGGDFGVITELYVDRDIRSKGIGKLLIKSALDFGRNQNWTRIEVGAPNKDEWPRTLDFYKRNGFDEKGIKLRISIS